VVDKPVRLTSHDVVARVRRAVGGGKVGHAGTLDPFATGVLVICLGAATRLAAWATAADKRYWAELTLGVETDTYDLTGTVVWTRSVTGVDRAAIERALANFVGDVEQRPPAFSAIHVGGRRMYDLVRRGEAVELAPRRVTIHRLDVLGWEPPRLSLDVTCSKGTYVRSLAHDLGAVLGTGAHLSALRRLASGRFGIEMAVQLDEAIEAIETGRGAELLQPLELAVEHLPRLDAEASGVARLRRGQPIERADPAVGCTARVHGPDGRLVAIVDRRNGAWWPSRVLPT
jgi:tRNA pseudouridine55 synthase